MLARMGLSESICTTGPCGPSLSRYRRQILNRALTLTRPKSGKSSWRPSEPSARTTTNLSFSTSGRDRGRASTALRYKDVDLKYASARIYRSLVQGKEAGTKTRRSNREIHLHDNVVAVLQNENPAPLNTDPEDYFFTTPAGTPIDESNFYKREWLPILTAKKIRPRPFYNTRHSYVSFLYSIGARSGFISSQTGDSIKTLEADYAKYIEEADQNRQFGEAQIQKSATQVQPPYSADDNAYKLKKKKGLRKQPLKDGAGEEGRTPDLMLGKHTL